VSIASVRYHRIRTWHFVETLADWLKGLDKTVVALLAIAGPGLIAILALVLLAAADGLTSLTRPSTSLTNRLLNVCLWQAVTFGLLWCLRDAILMPRAAAFFASLPVSHWEKLRADVNLCAVSYSVLWLPVLWAIGVGFSGGADSSGTLTSYSLLALVAFSLLANLLLLHRKLRGFPLVIPGLIAFTLPDSAVGIASETGVLVLCGVHVVRSYRESRTLHTYPRNASALLERIAIKTGLAVPLFAHELYASLSIRLLTVSAMLALIPLLSEFREAHGLQRTGFVMAVAIAVIAFHDLPALCRSTAFAKLPFIAAQKNFVRRVSIFALGMSAVLYGCALLCACFLTMFPLDSLPPDPRQLMAPAVFFTTAFLAGTIAAMMGWPSARWLMPVVNVVAAIVMSGFI
jgi:Family of unknown function (DUF6136)